MRVFCFFLAFSLLRITAQGQDNNTPKFIRNVYDFGTIKEDDGIQSCEFEFVNRSTSPLFVKEVRTSCGCTQPEYDKKGIAPGQNGMIRVGYDPVNRPGDFERMLIVSFGNRTKEDTLVVKGFVEKGEIQRCPGFRFRFGGLCVRRKTIVLKNFHPEKPRQENILIRNTSDEDIVLQFNGVSDQFTLSTEPRVVKPGAEADLVVTYRPEYHNPEEQEFSYEVRQINEKEDKLLFNLRISTEPVK